MILHTIGDPLGIGPEVTAKWLSSPLRLTTPEIEVYGDITTLRETASQLGLALPPESEQVRYCDTGSLNPGKLPGQIAYAAIEQAVNRIACAPANASVALVTGPINKKRLWQAGIPAHGHTEILQALAQHHWPGQTHQAEMLFLFERFRLILLSRHIPLREVGKTLTVEGVIRCLSTLVEFLQQQGIAHPSLAVMGVNPHGGEIGADLADNEERCILQPAIDGVNVKFGLSIGPPLAADALFRGFNPENPGYDAFVASYHDQGLIPMKLVAGYRAVNVTIGLPFLRTSVSHGTADDIAGKGIADAEGLHIAIQAAQKILKSPA